MEQFEFKCPQCGQMVSADESSRGLVFPCPHCEKGIVVPQKAKKPILAPIPQRPAVQTDEDRNLQSGQRRMEESISGQKKKEKKMSARVKPSTSDWLKLLGLLLVIGVVAVDIVLMHGKNKSLWNMLASQKAEAEAAVKAAEVKANEAVAQSAQKVKDSERKVSETRRKAMEAESRLQDQISDMRAAHQKAMNEQKESFEKRIQEMQDEFNNRINNLRSSSRPAAPQQRRQEDPPQTVRCSRCSGIGTIKVKERCAKCGGQGKIRQESYGTRSGLNRSSTSISNVYVDCPACIPGTFKGGGSKGYRIESKPCPKCGGTGSMSAN